MKKLVKKTKRNFRRLTKSGISILCLLLMLALLTGAVFAAAEESALAPAAQHAESAAPVPQGTMPGKGLGTPVQQAASERTPQTLPAVGAVKTEPVPGPSEPTPVEDTEGTEPSEGEEPIETEGQPEEPTPVEDTEGTELSEGEEPIETEGQPEEPTPLKTRRGWSRPRAKPL